MKLSQLKEVAVTHKEYDSITTQVLSSLRSLFDVDELVTQAKESPYVQDKAKLDNAIISTMKQIDVPLDPHTKSNVIERIRQALGV